MNKVVEYHWVENPISKVVTASGKVETRIEWIPMVKRVLYRRKFFFFWVPVKKQAIRQTLNEWTLSSAVRDSLDSHIWYPDLQEVDEIKFR